MSSKILAVGFAMACAGVLAPAPAAASLLAVKEVLSGNHVIALGNGIGVGENGIEDASGWIVFDER